ncbi:MAG: trypsin-like peptidase domain-containing protein [Chromatiaceae bacterium]|nr:trypsin-like peptidase domain-containing protein [Chromatiaceae bacterium]
MKTGSAWSWALTAFALGAGATLITIWSEPQLLQSGRMRPPGNSSQGTAGSVPTSYADAIARAGPAVVNIFSTKLRTERQPLAFTDPYLQRRFGALLPERLQRKSATSLGSGVVLSRNGLMLTNRHIVMDADEIRAVLADGTDLDVTVVGFDPETDLAVLEASATNLSVIPIGRPEELRVGDVVLAIGNPFGIGQTVTMGIVGATGRTRLGISRIENFIQTDAAINPGNSGGALINARGELIGINTAIFSKSGGSEGVGFAIPVDLATDVMQQVLSKGRVVRGWIGIVGRSVTPQLAESFGLRAHSGVLVSSTLENSPAERAGLRPGDVVTRVGDRAVATTHELLAAISAAGPGSDIELEVWRGSERIAARTKTVERPRIAGH